MRTEKIGIPASTSPPCHAAIPCIDRRGFVAVVCRIVGCQTGFWGGARWFPAVRRSRMGQGNGQLAAAVLAPLPARWPADPARGPRSTTRRNVDYYFWAWSAPESIPFGAQVQDGGGVLGFSYHDLMSRLLTAGPDDAARRLREICAWFDETQAAGGYRTYYSDPARGTLQGGNVPGGLGLDKEFFESVLVPQVMI